MIREGPTAEEVQAELDRIVSTNRIQWVENEVMDFRRGFIDKLRCPYCQALNRPDENFCCAKMTTAVAAVALSIELQERMDKAAQIADRVN